MRAKSLSDILKKGDRIAVSNITGREASKVSIISQRYCGNIVAGWALGKAGQTVEVPGAGPIPVFGQFDEMIKAFPETKKPTKRIAVFVRNFVEKLHRKASQKKVLKKQKINYLFIK